MNKIAYIRTSTQEQTPELQLENLSTICDFTDCEIHSEQLSAWSDNVKRPIFENILSLIKKKKVSHLYVWDLDRLHRNRSRLTELFILCKNYDCVIHSYRQPWLESFSSIPAPWNTIFMDLLIQILGWISEEESTKKSERVKNAVRKVVGKKTKSFKGNEWGRKPLPKQTIDRVLQFHIEGKSIREISKLVKIYDKHNNERNISKSSVHKIIGQKSPEKGS